MCGILAVITAEDALIAQHVHQYDELVAAVQRRGSDVCSSHSIEGVGFFVGAVLHIRGTEACSQPVTTPNGNLLLWNGEVFGGHALDDLKSDTLLVASLLDECESAEDVAQALASVHGPYAFVFFHAQSRSIFYGRDPFGRRSLVVGVPRTPSPSLPRMIISSVTNESAYPNMTWTEAPVGGVFVLKAGNEAEPMLAPWPAGRCTLERPLADSIIDDNGMPSVSQAALGEAVDEFQSLLLDAVRRRVVYLHRSVVDAALLSGPAPAHIAILFSGGLDSTVVAAMAHLCCPAGEAIDLLNVSFDSAERAPDRLAAICSLADLKRLYPDREWRLVHVDVPPDEVKTYTARVTNLVYPCETHMDFNIGSAFWFASRGVGYVMDYDGESVLQCLNVNREGQALLRQTTGHDEAKEHTDSKSLQQEGCAQERSSSQPCGNCRRVAKIGCAFELCKKCCVQRMQQNDGADRCFVHKPRTKAEQTHSTNEELELASTMVYERYESKAKVLLIGIGADEQMAGYGRHRSVFLKGGWRGLQQELRMDTGRLWQRNLGRDDRCTSDHGREARFPFLDENVVQFLHRTPLNVIADLSLPAGQGDKRLLRIVANRMGLEMCAGLVKRAIQFGTRAAQQTNRRVHGSNRKGKGDTVFDSKEDG